MTLELFKLTAVTLLITALGFLFYALLFVNKINLKHPGPNYDQRVNDLLALDEDQIIDNSIAVCFDHENK